MINNFQKPKRLFFSLFNTKAAGLYLILFAAAIGIATFVENDFGTSAAQKVIFKSWWFELLLFLFGISILVNIFKFRMIPQRKWPILLFHTSILIILIGAGVTRYFGFEGVMHIRENNASNSFLSSNSFLKFNVSKGGQTYDFEEPVLFASLGSNEWHESYLLGEDLIEIKVTGFIPNPKQRLVESINGKPTLQLVIAGLNGREEYFIHQGQTKRIRNLVFNFKET
ncbi:cytochrome c biogenesis protein ResB [Pareuzebyella sediminis]|uniref:cytochrome c biogenesis protein ResB n=1 Tax=Pareuzebyella sediminis TaxID=2607998 RepID=UPI0011F018BE|nr:cytochrome c biogenesis protein ResB [Pareuzebyella sediminis]